MDSDSDGFIISGVISRVMGPVGGLKDGSRSTSIAFLWKTGFTGPSIPVEKVIGSVVVDSVKLRMKVKFLNVESISLTFSTSHAIHPGDYLVLHMPVFLLGPVTSFF